MKKAAADLDVDSTADRGLYRGGGGGGGGVEGAGLSLEVNNKVSHIPLGKLINIPLIKYPKYPISLVVNKNIPEITNTK